MGSVAAALAFERLPGALSRYFNKEVSRGAGLDLPCRLLLAVVISTGGPRGQGGRPLGWVLSGDTQSVLKQAQKKVPGPGQQGRARNLVEEAIYLTRTITLLSLGCSRALELGFIPRAVLIYRPTLTSTFAPLCHGNHFIRAWLFHLPSGPGLCGQALGVLPRS